jgi:hypothetical protein
MPDNSNVQKIEQLTRLMLIILAGLLVVLLALTVTFFATKPSNKPVKNPDSTTDGQSSSDPVTDPVILTETSDAGIDYQNSIIFVGDSLTAHIRSRAVLTGGTATKQVWCPENNMMNLNSEVTAAKIIFPGTGEKMTVAEAAARAKPEIMIITLGTDWGVSYLSESEFKACYAGLIQAIQKASPKTKIILQSIFPVTAGCVNLDNGKIDNANKWVKAISADNGCRYLDTQSILKDDKNCLKENYCNSSDGIHMGKEAYVAILEYIRTHALTD